MRLTFTPPSDGLAHSYCLSCGTEGVTRPRVRGRLMYHCQQCGHINPRALVIDPVVKWWSGADHEYWHEASGIFVANDAAEFLFFERNQYPFGLTVPAGHVEAGEPPGKTAERELLEETRVRRRDLVHVVTDDVRGDGCHRGSDAHRWHAYAVRVPSATTVSIDEAEGARPVWLGLRQALERDLTFVTRYMITQHGTKILRAVR